MLSVKQHFQSIAAGSVAATITSSVGHFVADGTGALCGRSGAPAVTYTVEVYPSLRGELKALLPTTEAVLGNSTKGWIARGSVALLRVNDPARARIRIVLAPPSVVDWHCRRVGLDTAGL